jgi:hypothetical protein
MLEESTMLDQDLVPTGPSHVGGAAMPKWMATYREALRLPFRQDRWPAKIWWLSAVGFIPVIDLLVLRGWRLDVTRRIALGEPDVLPDGRDVVRFLANGVILWTMTLLYFVIPFLIIFATGTGTLRNIWQTVQWLYLTLLTDQPTMPLTEILGQELGRFLGRVAIEGAWVVISWPLYRTGMLRFAITGNPLAFFRVFANLVVVLKNLRAFVMLFLYELPTFILMMVVSAILTATGLGALLVPAVSMPLYYWITGFEYGHLAHELGPQLRRIRGVAPAALSPVA